MSFKLTMPRTLRVFIAYPGDVQEEKDRLIRAINGLRSEAADRRIFLKEEEWHQCIPDLGVAQEVLFQQLKPEAWDIFVGILWGRFDTPCGIREQGTERELLGTEAENPKLSKSLRPAKGRPWIMIYRSTRPPKSLNDVQGAQLKVIDDFLRNCESRGKHPTLVKSCEQPYEFERHVSEHLRQALGTVELEEVKRAREVQRDHLRKSKSIS